MLVGHAKNIAYKFKQNSLHFKCAFNLFLILNKKKLHANSEKFDPLCNHAEMMLQRKKIKKSLHATQKNLKSV